MAGKKGQFSMGIYTYVWMFLKTYEWVRNFVVNNYNISSLIQLEYNAFSAACVPVCTFTIRNQKIKCTGEYIQLSDFKGIENQPIKVLESIKNPYVKYRYTVNQRDYSKIPGSPIAYWASDNERQIFSHYEQLGNLTNPVKGLDTCDNDRFIRLWSEVIFSDIGLDLGDIKETELNYKWFSYSKGGDFRKWYGNYEYIVNWQNNGEILRNLRDTNGKIKSRPQNTRYYFKEGITWLLSAVQNLVFDI